MIYNIAKDFSPYPAGRIPSESDYSGQRFREILAKELKKGKLEIELDGLRLTGSSFLEESFGGLIRHNYFTEKELKKLLTFKTRKPFLEEEIWLYIDKAIPSLEES